MTTGPLGIPLTDPKTGKLNPQWLSYFNSSVSTSLIAAQYFSSNNTNVGSSPTTITSLSIPASNLTAGAGCVIRMYGTCANNANTKKLLVNLSFANQAPTGAFSIIMADTLEVGNILNFSVELTVVGFAFNAGGHTTAVGVCGIGYFDDGGLVSTVYGTLNGGGTTGMNFITGLNNIRIASSAQIQIKGSVNNDIALNAVVCSAL